jgi:Response regulator containing a CheY-like receiver domain and an HTH DNA-binding domain
LVVAEGLGLTQSLLLRLPRRLAVRVLGPVADGYQALEAAQAGLMGLVLVDLDRTDGRAWEIITSIADGAGVPVLAVASAGSVDDAARALASGATGVIRGEGGDVRELAASLRRAAARILVLPDVDLPLVVEQFRYGPPARERVHDLTTRELQVLRAMAGGASCADIAQMLRISPLTVRAHTKNVMGKLGVHSKVEAVTFALREGLAGDRRTA